MKVTATVTPRVCFGFCDDPSTEWKGKVILHGGIDEVKVVENKDGLNHLTIRGLNAEQLRLLGEEALRLSQRLQRLNGERQA